MNLPRRAALLVDEWPTTFTTMLEQRFNMDVGPHSMILTVSYLGNQLTDRQRRDIKVFLVNRRTEQMHSWLTEVTTRLQENALSAEWVRSQDFSKDLEFICRIRIAAVFNFPCDTPTIPNGRYPLAFILTSL